jgi:2-oxoglutarate dehydrogenase E1 component
MRVANCTTAAQYFHLLRLHAVTLKDAPQPLVIFSPKSLLRHPLVASSAIDLAEAVWNPVLDDPTINDPVSVRRVVFCTGKVAIDLLGHADRSAHPDTAIIRIEQLVPFPQKAVQQVFDRYKNIEEVAWVQEEPENMGAWAYIQPKLFEFIQGRFPLRYLGRGMSSSPAEGSFSWHEMNQSSLVAQAFSREIKEANEGVIVIKG